MTSGFQLFTRATLETVLAKGISSKGPFFQTEIKTHCRDLRVAEIPIQYNAGRPMAWGAERSQSHSSLSGSSFADVSPEIYRWQSKRAW
jgi:hypothetical protein